jgi:hypothetical protein
MIFREQLECCGYFGVSDAVIGGTYCQDVNIVQTTIADAQDFCVGPITEFADRSLNMAFT